MATAHIHHALQALAEAHQQIEHMRARRSRRSVGHLVEVGS